jgi:maltose/moltooligosaccharide transporter
MQKPSLSKKSIWNMSAGFLGIQFGFALQNSNGSRILQTFGANVENLSWFWLVAPLTGLIVQPIIGHYSDKTWTKLGRRKPFFLAGSIIAAIGLMLIPNSHLFIHILPALFMGAIMLMVMDASFNVAMEPFRALVADNLSASQRTEGFAAQTTLIGIGAVIGSWLPSILSAWCGVPKVAAANEVPLNVVYSFIIGAVVLVGSILWTLFTTKEYSPEEFAAFDDHKTPVAHSTGIFTSLGRDIAGMPKTMKQLGWVQFFSWFALFGMWVFMTPALAHHIYGLDINDKSSEAYNDAGNWVGVIFGVYNFVSAIYAFFILPKMAEALGRKKAHMISLILGGLGLISVYFAPNKEFLIISMIGLGAAWASILAMPYAILAGSIPAHKMGVYMGIFNLFITVPQIVNAVFSGQFLMKHVYHGQAIYAIVVSGICLILAAFATLLVEDKDELSSGKHVKLSQ